MFTPIDALPSDVIGLEAHGRVASAETLKVLLPRIDSAGRSGAKVRLLYVAGPDFDGYADGAFLDDAVFGTRHFNSFERIAFVGEGPHARAVEALNGLMPTALRRFASGDIEKAKRWISRKS
jgi:hypothetical protein